MIDKVIGPSARIMRVLIISPAVAVALLYGVRDLSPLPWMTIRFLTRGMLGLTLNHQEFLLDGYRYPTGEWIWQGAYRAIAASPEASATVALALFLGGVVALGVNRAILLAYTHPMRSMN